MNTAGSCFSISRIPLRTLVYSSTSLIALLVGTVFSLADQTIDGTSEIVGGPSNTLGTSLSVTGILYVGDTSTNSALTIEQGGTVSSTDDGYIGFSSSGTGSVAVTGSDSSLTIGDLFTVGRSGTGTLTISDGATVSSVEDGYIGFSSTGTGSVAVTGSGSSLTIGDLFTVGRSGNGTLTISDGATVSSIDDGTIGNRNGSTGSVTVTGSGSSLTIGDYFYVGSFGTGTLTVSDGAEVSSTNESEIGLSSTGTGSVAVTGSGSSLTIGDSFTVGSSGTGTLTISDGATVSSIDDGTIGNRNGSTGSVTVTGSGSSLTIGDDLFVGSSGTGTLTVSDGAVANVNNGDIIFGTSGSSTNTLNIGAAAGDTAAAAGFLNTDSIDFNNTGILVFNHTDTDYSVDADISGNGSVELYSGTTAFNGTNTFTGNTTIYGGTLGGAGILDDVIAMSGGTIAPGNSIGTINVGNLTLGAGSTLEIEADPTSGLSDKVVVTGTVDVSGSTLAVKESFTAYTGPNLVYTIIENDDTDAVTGTFSTISNDLAFLTASVDYAGDTGNDVVLTLAPPPVVTTVTPPVVTTVTPPVVTTVTPPVVTTVIPPVVTTVTPPVVTTVTPPVVTPVTPAVIFANLTGVDVNQKSVGIALDQLSITTGSAGESLRNLLMPLTTSQARKTFTDLGGEVHSSGSQNMFDVGGNVGDQVAGRFSNLAGSGSIGSGFGYSAAVQTLSNNSAQDYFSTDLAQQNNSSGNSNEFGYGYTPVSGADIELQYWGVVSGYYANSEGDGNAQGTNSAGYGLVLGVDRTLGDTTWGAAFGYAKTMTQTDDDLSELDINSISAAVYGQTMWDDYHINGLAAYTYHMIDGSRTISNISATAFSDYYAHQLTLQSEVSRTFTYDHNKDINPFLLGRYMHVSTSSYSETGAGAANLVSNGENYWSLDLILGARIELEIDDLSKLTLGAGYSYRLGDVNPEATYAFSSGGTFTTEGVSRNRHSAYLEAGFERQISAGTKFFAGASSNLTDTHQSIGGNIGLKVSF